MATASLVPKNGALTMTGYVMDFATFELTSTQSVEEVTPYGSNTCAKNVGAGTPTITTSIGAYGMAHATSNPLKMDILEAAGVASVFTLDTGVTETFTMVIESKRISHGRMRAAVPIAITGRNAGDVTEAWAVS